MAKAVPFHKRFPGRHAVSAVVVLPSGSRVEIVGPFPEPTAECVLALLSGDPSEPRAQQLIAELRLELAPVLPEDSEPGASGSVDRSVTPVEHRTANPELGPDCREPGTPEGSAGGGVEVAPPRTPTDAEYFAAWRGTRCREHHFVRRDKFDSLKHCVFCRIREDVEAACVRHEQSRKEAASG